MPWMHSLGTRTPSKIWCPCTKNFLCHRNNTQKNFSESSWQEFYQNLMKTSNQVDQPEISYALLTSSLWNNSDEAPISLDTCIYDETLTWSPLRPPWSLLKNAIRRQWGNHPVYWLYRLLRQKSLLDCSSWKSFSDQTTSSSPIWSNSKLSRDRRSHIALA